MTTVAPAPLYLIDASIYIFRYYFAMPDRWFSRDGYPTAAIYGYSCWLLQILRQSQPVKIAACFDESLGSCFRNELYPAYKASRALPDAELAFQLKMCREITECLGVATYSSQVYEADDLIGTLATRARQQGRSVCILTKDKDLLQLLRAGDTLWDAPDAQPLGPDDVKAHYGVAPSQFADYLALTGDAGDDVPGIPGVGPKTAAALLRAYRSIPELLQHVDEVSSLPVRGASSVAAKLAAHAEQLTLMRQLTQIRCSAPLGRRMQLNLRKPRLAAAEKLANALGFGANFTRSLYASVPTAVDRNTQSVR